MDFKILGQLEVSREGVPVDLGPPRQRALLARLLISAGEVVTADRLVEDLWPGHVPETARHALHVYVSRLRNALGPDRLRLEHRGAGYCLRLDPHELDAYRFEQLVAAGRAALIRGDPQSAQAHLSAALSMWRGSVLADTADEAFVRAEAVRLNEIRITALEQRVAADLELGHHAELVEELQDLVARHPYRERFWEQLMLTLYRCGRQAEALRVFQTARTRLAEELGIDPGPALLHLEEQILTHDPALSLSGAPDPGTIPNNLPLQRTSFIGRKKELELGRELLAKSRLITLIGPPGSGKTRTAIRLAADHTAGFPHGSFFIPLAAVTDVGLIAGAISQTLGLREVPGETPLEGLKAHLHDRRALLLLDNFEQIIEGAPLIGELLDAAPDIKIMVTSRSRLGISGEQEFPIPPLTVPPAHPLPDLETLSTYDAIALFLARARASDPSFDLDAANAAAVAEIAMRLDGLPLAIELAAARIRLLGPQDLADRLGGGLAVLTGTPADAVGRHRTLRQAIAWSYDLLPLDEQVLFRRLGIFHGFTLEAATNVADLSETEVLDGVDSLLSKSLLYRLVGSGKTRFAMLETLREFALEKLGSAGEENEVAERHALHFCHLAEATERQLTSETQHSATEKLSQEMDNIRSALRYACDSAHPDLGLLLAGCIWRFWQSSGRLTEGRQWLESLLATSGASDAARAKGLTGLAGLAYWQGDYEDAEVRYKEGLDLYRAIGDRAGEADTLFGLSMTAAWTGNLETGDRLAGEARSMFEELGAKERIGEIHMAQALTSHRRGDHSTARPLWRAALAISRELGDQHLLVTQQIGLAICEYHDGNLSRALEIALETLDEATDLENIHLTAWMLDFISAFAAPAAPEAAVRLAGAVDSLRQAAGGRMKLEPLGLENARTAAARLLSPGELERAWAEGRKMTLEESAERAKELRTLSGSPSGKAVHPTLTV